MKFTNIYGKTYSNEFKLFEYTLCVDRDKIPTYVHHHRHSAVWLGPTLCGHWVVKDSWKEYPRLLQRFSVDRYSKRIIEQSRERCIDRYSSRIIDRHFLIDQHTNVDYLYLYNPDYLNRNPKSSYFQLSVKTTINPTEQLPYSNLQFTTKLNCWCKNRSRRNQCRKVLKKNVSL
ncbi:hypothetical protein YC2023_117236 [Brassica napus]